MKDKLMVEIKTYFVLQDALMDESVLLAARIPCYLLDTNMGSIYGPTLTQGIRLMVREADVEEAIVILSVME